MKLHIFYRHLDTSKYFEIPKERPQWFNYEKCFVNLLDTIQKHNISLNVVYDGNDSDNFIFKYKDKFNLYRIEQGSDFGSFVETWKLVKESHISDDELIYFLENDYLHQKDWYEKVVDFFKKHDHLTYLSLYDHLDKYIFDDYINLQSQLMITQNHHWRTTPSTCGSFIITKKLFDLDYDIHTNIYTDHGKFLKLNQERGRKVVTPIPGLSTHCSYDLLSPTIDWYKINEETHE